MSFLKLFISTSISHLYLSPSASYGGEGETGLKMHHATEHNFTCCGMMYIHWKHNPIAWNNSNAALVGSANLQLFAHLSFLLNYSLIWKPGTANMRDSEHFCEQAWVNIITCTGHVPSWYFWCSL